VFYYVTVTNENEAQPSIPKDAREGILRGMHCVSPAKKPEVRLLGAGPLLKEAMAAADLLEGIFSVKTEVWSVTSFSELARDGIACERNRRLQKSDDEAWVTQKLKGSKAPLIAVSDYVRAVPESIRAYVPACVISLRSMRSGLLIRHWQKFMRARKLRMRCGRLRRSWSWIWIS